MHRRKHKHLGLPVKVRQSIIRDQAKEVDVAPLRQMAEQ